MVYQPNPGKGLSVTPVKLENLGVTFPKANERRYAIRYLDHGIDFIYLSKLLARERVVE